MEEGVVVSTDLMEAYSLEIADQILVNGEIYKIVNIADTPEGYNLKLVDEEGGHHQMPLDMYDKVRLIVDTLAEV